MARRPAHAPLNVYLNARHGRPAFGVRAAAQSISPMTPRGLLGATPFPSRCLFRCEKTDISAPRSLPSSITFCPTTMTFAAASPNARTRVGPTRTACWRRSAATVSAHFNFCRRAKIPARQARLTGAPCLTKEVAEIISNLARNPLGIGADQEFRISLAGAQEKTALLYWKDKWYVPHGTTATTHIIKPQIGHPPNGIDLTNSVENEHFCLQLVAALGLPAATSRIIDFAGKRVLAIERFDRIWTRDGRLLRLPQEDCLSGAVSPAGTQI